MRWSIFVVRDEEIARTPNLSASLPLENARGLVTEQGKQTMLLDIDHLSHVC